MVIVAGNTLNCNFVTHVRTCEFFLCVMTRWKSRMIVDVWFGKSFENGLLIFGLEIRLMQRRHFFIKDVNSYDRNLSIFAGFVWGWGSNLQGLLYNLSLEASRKTHQGNTIQFISIVFLHVLRSSKRSTLFHWCQGIKKSHKLKWKIK